jgi:predicted transcriptional regulator
MVSVVSFPATYPDEDYRSIMFRYYLRSPHISYLKNRKELIGKATPKMILYPENLMCLIDDLGVSSNFINELIENHTYYSIIRPFITEKTKEECLNTFLYSMSTQTQSWKILLGVGKQFISEHVRYCPSCLHDDIEVYGESYLHREHQYAFLTVCPIHEVSLISYCPICNEPLVSNNASRMLFEPKCINGHIIYYDYSNMRLEPLQRDLLSDLKTLMTIKEISLNQIFQRLVTSLGSRGYIHFKGNYIYKKRLLTELIGYYGEENLKRIGIDVKDLTNESVISQMLKKENLRKHILFYIIMMRFLAGSVSNFLKLDEYYFNPLPFGPGPWLCINPICPQYNERVITQCKRKVHEWVTGIFSCPHCGMVFTRKGLPYEEDENQLSIETMGSLFINLATIYYEKGYDLTTIGSMLHSNRTTVRKYLKPYRTMLHQNNKNIESEVEQAMNEIIMGQNEVASATMSSSKLEICKITVQNAIQSIGKGATRPQIRRYNIHRYDWVMKHDREWMERHLPPRRKHPSSINLSTMDEELFGLVNNAVIKIWDNPPKQKVSKTQIFKELPSYVKARCYNYPQYLPKTMELIEESLETNNHYLVRRFPEVLQWFYESRYGNLSLRLIQNRFKGYKECSPEVIQFIEKQIYLINSKNRKL